MGSNERDQTLQHHPLHISSLVVRPSGSNDGEGDRHAAAEDDSRDRPSIPRSDRHKSDNGSYLLHNYYITSHIVSVSEFWECRKLSRVLSVCRVLRMLV